MRLPDQEIRDLNYAHWDAQVFAAFLQSNAGGSLGSQQMRLLVNSQATMAAIQAGLEWVMQTARKGDRVIFYFSGHGDVETINDQEKGYLLAYDTPRNNYRLNAIDLTYLNEHLVRELSLREVQLILITGCLPFGGSGGRRGSRPGSHRCRVDETLCAGGPDHVLPAVRTFAGIHPMGARPGRFFVLPGRRTERQRRSGPGSKSGSIRTGAFPPG
ncbi:MAG: caspase family protein [Haliscomenobacter sp.]|nr:caspase family protein [Haliscomenobacter sp.]